MNIKELKETLEAIVKVTDELILEGKGEYEAVNYTSGTYLIENLGIDDANQTVSFS